MTGAGQQLGDGVTIQDCGPSCWPAPFGMVLTVLIAVLMSVCIVVTTFGNLLVIVSFAVDRQIRQPTNYFICSLAVTDVLIGTVSMPFYTVRTENKIYSRSRDMLVSRYMCLLATGLMNWVQYYVISGFQLTTQSVWCHNLQVCQRGRLFNIDIKIQ